MEYEEKKRYSREIKVNAGIWDAYAFYKRKKPKSVINKSMYVAICKSFNLKLSEKIIKESFEYRIPHMLGFIRIKSFKQKLKVDKGKIVAKRNAINWGACLDLWERMYGSRDRVVLREIKNKPLVYHLNEHTNGYSMKWYWDKRRVKVANGALYQFKPVKGGVHPSGVLYGRKGLAAWVQDEDRTNEYFL